MFRKQNSTTIGYLPTSSFTTIYFGKKCIVSQIEKESGTEFLATVFKSRCEVLANQITDLQLVMRSVCNQLIPLFQHCCKNLEKYTLVAYNLSQCQNLGMTNEVVNFWHYITGYLINTCSAEFAGFL